MRIPGNTKIQQIADRVINTTCWDYTLQCGAEHREANLFAERDPAPLRPTHPEQSSRFALLSY
jgi:hypothetical protein